MFGMTASRRYQLLCPVARSLDVLGDRWSLLVLRDLHAGPARFHELQSGLGIATNLLSTRLADLQSAGLVRRAGDGVRAPYELTDLGRGTDRVLWELVRFGGRLDRDPDPRPPGNLRTLALPLRMMFAGVVHEPDLRTRLLVDDDAFVVHVTPRGGDVVYGDRATPVDVELRATYDDLLDAAEGIVAPADLAADRIEVRRGADRAPEFLALLDRVLTAA